MMKRTNRYFTAIISLVMLILLTWACKKEGSYTLTELPPIDFKSYYDGLNVTFANQTKGATEISWNFGDSTSVATGDSVQHAYKKIGNYPITMNGTYQGKQYVFHTILRVDKPSVVKLDDNSFADWDKVLYPDFQFEGTSDLMLGGKVDYDANNVYFFVKWLSTASDGSTSLDNAVMDLYIDSDNSFATGYSISIGADYLIEGNVPNWLAYSQFTGTVQSDWGGWQVVDLTDVVKLGNTETAGDTVKMEFAVSRDKLKITKDAFRFQLTMSNSNWSEIGTLKTIDSSKIETTIPVKMDKQ